MTNLKQLKTELMCNIPELERTEARLSKLKYKISDRILENFKGRPTIKASPSCTPNSEGKNLSRSHIQSIRTYPRRIINDKQKFAHLKKLLLTKQIGKPIFIELADVLSLRRKGFLINDALRGIQQ